MPLAGAGLIGGGLDFDGGVLKIGAGNIYPVAGREEQMPIRLLNGDGQFLLGTRFELPHLVLLMLGQVRQAVWAPQGPQGQAEAGAALHLRPAMRVGGHEGKMVAQHPQGRAFGTLARVDALNQIRHFAHQSVDGHGVVGQHDQLGAAVAHFVRHIERAAGEVDGVEGGAVEDVPDAVVQFGAGVAGIHVALLAADDLVEVRLRQKTHGSAGAVVQIGGVRNELRAGFFDEADVQGWRQHRIAQLLGGKALQRFVEGQSVHEDRAGGVGGVRRQFPVVFGVQALGKRAILPAASRDVIGNGRREGGLAQTGDDLLPNGFMPQVDVVRMDGRGVRRPLLPKMGDGAGKQAQHAAHALELADGGGLAGQRLQNFGVQRIAGRERLRRLRVAGFRRQRVSMLAPQALIGGDWAGLLLVNALEQPSAQHLRGFIVLGGVQQGGFAGGNAFRLRHPVGHELIFLAVGVAGLAIAANRQGVNQRGVGGTLHGLEKGSEEGGELIPGALGAPHFAQIHRDFIQQNQRRLAAEQFAQGFGTGGHALLVAVLHPLVTRPARQRISDFAPRRVRQHLVAHRPAIGRVGVLAIERGDAHRTVRKQAGVEELGHIPYAVHALRGMDQRDQAMRLAPAV